MFGLRVPHRFDFTMSKNKNVFCSGSWCESRAFEGVRSCFSRIVLIVIHNLGFDSETRTRPDVALMLVPLTELLQYPLTKCSVICQVKWWFMYVKLRYKISDIVDTDVFVLKFYNVLIRLYHGFNAHNKKWHPHHHWKNLTGGFPDTTSISDRIGLFVINGPLLKEMYRFTMVSLKESFFLNVYPFVHGLMQHRCDSVWFQSMSSLHFQLWFKMIISNGERVSPSYPGGLARRLHGAQIWISPLGLDFLRLFEFPQKTVQNFSKSWEERTL